MPLKGEVSTETDKYMYIGKCVSCISGKKFESIKKSDCPLGIGSASFLYR